MGEKQDVQLALDNATASAEALKGQLTEAEARATGLQVGARTRTSSGTVSVGWGMLWVPSAASQAPRIVLCWGCKEAASWGSSNGDATLGS
jgi:hypothetical protein